MVLLFSENSSNLNRSEMVEYFNSSGDKQKHDVPGANYIRHNDSLKHTTKSVNFTWNFFNGHVLTLLNTCLHTDMRAEW